MTRRLIDAALGGSGRYAGKCYFFSGPIYVRYDWTQDRVDDGYPQRLGLWKLPAPLDAGFDDAVDGRGTYAGKAYFFRGNQYVRYDWGNDAPEGGVAPLSAWSLPAPFDQGIDATLDGGPGYDGKLYFFKGSQYVRYDWAQDRIDQAAAPLSAWNLPAGFAQLDAALGGGDPGVAYFFKDERYCRYHWANERVDGARPVVGAWHGVAELLQAGNATLLARDWVRAAMDALARVAAGTEPPGSTTYTALTTHFKADWQTHLATIRGGYETLARHLDEMPRRYRHRRDDEAATDGMVKHGRPFPAYATHNGTITFTTSFTEFGPRSQAAMVAHECVHLFDAGSGAADVHISEWYLTADPAIAIDPGWTTTYTAQPSAKAAHNPSAFAAFAQHVFYGSDTRYGAMPSTRHL